MPKLIIGFIAIVSVMIGLFQLDRGRNVLSITKADVGGTPATIFRLPSSASTPVVVIAHGFAGSQQLMQPFAETLARNGYIAVTFDFLGHGRNRSPMRGDIAEGRTITAALQAELADVAAWAGRLPGSDGRLAVLGHSMASDIVVRFAQATPEVAATVAVSVFSPVVTAVSPRNLLVIVGALEPAMLRNESLRIINLTAGGSAAPGATYGRFSDGTARKLALAHGVEHIGVLYSQDSMAEALSWFDTVFGRQTSGVIDRRGPWLALVFLGIVALAWPLSSLLPIAGGAATGPRLGRKALLIASLAPPLLTPLLLWKMPTDFLPILLGDYLALHFLLYGGLTMMLVLYLRRPRLPDAADNDTQPVSRNNIVVATVAVAAYNIIAFGLPIDTYVFSFLPIPERLPVMAAIACGTLPYFIADEWLTRSPDAGRGVYALTKFCFLMSLAIAVALNPMKLFFLVIIVPAILLLFLAFGLISRWTYAATQHPLPGAIANAAVFAWGIAVTFPMIVR